MDFGFSIFPEGVTPGWYMFPLWGIKFTANSIYRSFSWNMNGHIFYINVTIIYIA
jgi:hypothetical protein